MITQKTLCVKMDAATLEDLNEECNKFGKKRNRCINIAVQQWIERQDKERKDSYWRSVGDSSYDEKACELGKYILNNLTGEQYEHIRFSAKGVGCSPEYLMFRFIECSLEDFKKRPFVYL